MDRKALLADVTRVAAAIGGGALGRAKLVSVWPDRLVASDDLSIRIRRDTETARPFAADAERMRSALSALSTDEIDLSVSDSTVNLKGGNVRFSIPAHEAFDLPQHRGTSWTCPILRGSVPYVLWAARAASSMYLDWRSCLVLDSSGAWAGDGRRIHRAELTLSVSEPVGVRASALGDLPAGDLTLKVSDALVEIEAGDRTVVARRAEVPTSYQAATSRMRAPTDWLTCDRDRLARGASAVSSVSKTLVLEAAVDSLGIDSEQQGDAYAGLDCLGGFAGNLPLAIDARWLLEALRGFREGEIKIGTILAHGEKVCEYVRIEQERSPLTAIVAPIRR